MYMTKTLLLVLLFAQLLKLKWDDFDHDLITNKQVEYISRVML